MIHFLKRLRLLYVLYNFFHKKKLAHNLPVYRKLGLKKNYYSSISSKDFKDIGEKKEDPGKDTAAGLRELESFRSLPEEDRSSLLNFNNEGYSILRNFFTEQQVEEANSEIERLLRNGKVKFKYGNRIMFAFRQSEALRSMGQDARLTDMLSTLLQTPAVLFQSINFLKGSEQHTHSDSIHMTTYPLGKLAAVWIALEDIDETNGPLHYYPKSHLLPYYLNADYDNEGNSWLIGDKTYTEYEKMIEEKIRESSLPKKIFTARKGDLLIWHANLFHGGEPHLDKTRTRKSMVFHYFGREAVCYHEITQRPAIMS
jgi:phytanoyl-CoA hydroxylase